MTRLVSVLGDIVADHFGGFALTLGTIAERPWASASFSGQRSVFIFRLDIGCDRTLLQQHIDAFSGASIILQGHIVADAFAEHPKLSDLLIVEFLTVLKDAIA